MPYKQIWFDAPHDMSISVIPGDKDTPPAGYVLNGGLYGCPQAIRDIAALIQLVQAGRKIPEDQPVTLYYCYHCRGWIAGVPGQYHEDNIGLLSGRRGEVFHCRRCGNEIGFFGMMS